MAFGLLGYSTVEWDESGEKSDSTGFFAECAVTDQFIGEAEIASRSLENDDEAFEPTVNSFSLRGSFKF